MNASYTIPDENLGKLTDVLSRLAKRATKLGQVLTWASAWLKDTTDAETGEVTRWFTVEITGTAPKLNGWAFVGTIQHFSDEGNILRTIPGSEVEVPTSYRSAAPLCAHCETVRARRDTYLVWSEASGIKQVGRQCLADFLGHADPHAVASWATLLVEAAAAAGELDGEPGEYRRSGAASYYSLGSYLPVVAAWIREEGWTSRGKARDTDATATADRATMQLFGRDPRRMQVPVTTADEEVAAASIAWAEELAGESDYEHAIRTIARTGGFDFRTAGFAASIVSGYQRHVGKLEDAKRAAASEHVGVVGKRQEFTVRLDRAVTLPDNGFGTRSLYILADLAGNRITWATGAADLEKGVTYQIKATVKDHSVYGGVKQTVVTRAKVLDARPDEALAAAA